MPYTKVVADVQPRPSASFRNKSKAKKFQRDKFLKLLWGRGWLMFVVELSTQTC